MELFPEAKGLKGLENMYEVSVIIPNFNGKKYLKDLNSMRKQDCKNFEVILVDNGSEDGSGLCVGSLPGSTGHSPKREHGILHSGQYRH